MTPQDYIQQDSLTLTSSRVTCTWERISSDGRRYQQLQLTVPCIYSRLMACQPVLQRATEFIRCSLQVQHEHPDYHVGHRET